MRFGMKYLLDTNIAILFLNKDPDIVRKIYNKFNISISTITIGELHYGFSISKYRESNLLALSNFLEDIDILSIDHSVAYRYSSILVKLKTLGKPIPSNDVWIAAVAQEHKLILVTRDKHFLDLDFIDTEYW